MSFQTINEMKWRNDVACFANQACYGIRYFLEGKNEDEIFELLKKGVKICDVLSKSAEAGQKEKIRYEELEYCKISHPLKEFSKDLTEVVRNSNMVLGTLNLMVEGKRPSKEETEYAKNFLCDMTEVYLNSVSNILSKSREESCF